MISTSNNSSSRRARLAVLIVFVVSAAALAVYFLVPHFANRKPDGPPVPVILISIDTLRADAVSGFGGAPDQTPELYQFGEEGIRFTTAISAAHITAPSHATMLTGFSPFVHGCSMGGQGKAWKIAERIPTLAETFRANGYHTGGFTDGVQLIPDAGFARGFDVYAYKSTGLEAKLPAIEKFLLQKPDQPFFLFLHTYRPHIPYRPPADLVAGLVKDYHGVFREAAIRASQMTHEQMIRPSAVQNKIGRELKSSNAKTPEDHAFLKKMYLSGVSGADREVGAVFQLLKKLNVYDRALILVTSDHGEAFQEHELDSHSTVHDECVRVPLIMRMPGGAAAGTTVEETFPAIDLVPTVVELSNNSINVAYEGDSHAREISKGNIHEKPAVSAWYYHGNVQWPSGRAVRSRSGKYMLLDIFPEMPDFVKKLGGAEVFYNLIRDRGEKVNALSSGDPEIGRLREFLKGRVEDWTVLKKRHRVEDRGGSDLSDEAIRDLEAIGYTGK